MFLPFATILSITIKKTYTHTHTHTHTQTHTHAGTHKYKFPQRSGRSQLAKQIIFEESFQKISFITIRCGWQSYSEDHLIMIYFCKFQIDLQRLHLHECPVHNSRYSLNLLGDASRFSSVGVHSIFLVLRFLTF